MDRLNRSGINVSQVQPRWRSILSSSSSLLLIGCWGPCTGLIVSLFASPYARKHVTSFRADGELARLVRLRVQSITTTTPTSTLPHRLRLVPTLREYSAPRSSRTHFSSSSSSSYRQRAAPAISMGALGIIKQLPCTPHYSAHPHSHMWGFVPFTRLSRFRFTLLGRSPFRSFAECQ